MALIQRIRVPAGTAFALIYLYFARPTPRLLATGLVLAGVGLGLRVWAAGHLRKGKELATSGPYQYCRNPLYLGSLFLGVGLAVASAQIWLMALFVILFASLYIPVMKKEEEELGRAFGPYYEMYRQRVPLFLPAPVSRIPDLPDPMFRGNFQWRRVILNREYRALAGFLLIAAFISIKMLWQF